MNILFIDWPCFGKVDTIFTFEQMGYSLTMFYHKDYEKRISKEYDDAFTEIITGKNFRFCFSFNYYPVVAENCKKYNIPYISIVYDSPHVPLYSYTVIYPTNYVFIFDKQEYLHLRNIGITTVYYTVLPVNATIIDYLCKKNFDRSKLTCDVSFVGALYDEDHNFYNYLANANNYTKGFLEALMEAQLKIYGYNFLEDVLANSEKIMEELIRVSPYANDRYGVETPEYIYANYFLCRKITSIERQRTLAAIAEHFPTKLFTLNKNAVIPHVQNMGAIDYYSEMPYVFSNSKINLNISLKSIQSGIPLRAMDILGAGGFLLTNFQADFLDCFIPDEDFVYYTDTDDLLAKIEYYLSHENERKEIAQNGHLKVLKNHSFEKCFQTILEIVFSDS